MKQKILILAGLMLLLVGSMNCYGFCVYNNTDLGSISATETSGGGWFTSFSQTVNKGEKQCCGWNDHGCNTSDRRDGIVTIKITRVELGIDGGRTICDPKIKAYQDIIVTGSNGHYQCRVR